MANFETALRNQIASNKATRRAKRLLAFLDAPRTKLRAARLKRMEQHAALEAGVAVGVDWAEIDWSKLFERILSLILSILPLFV